MSLLSVKEDNSNFTYTARQENFDNNSNSLASHYLDICASLFSSSHYQFATTRTWNDPTCSSFAAMSTEQLGMRDWLLEYVLTIHVKICDYLLTYLYRARKNAEFSDLTLRCGSKEFPVHRVVVCAQSSFLRAACTKNFKVRAFKPEQRPLLNFIGIPDIHN